MGYMSNTEFAPAGGIQELSFGEVDLVEGGALRSAGVIQVGGIALGTGND